MRVLLLDRALGNWYTLGLAEGLRANGVEAHVGGPLGFETSHRLSSGGIEHVYPRYGMTGRRVRKALDVGPSVANMAGLLRRLRPDVVHLQWSSLLDLLYGKVAKRLARSRIVVTVHVPRRRAPTEDNLWQARVLPLADALITHGPLLRDQLAAEHPALADRINVVECGNYAHVMRSFDRAEARARLGLAGGAPVYAFLGQVRPVKGVETLIRAFGHHAAAGRRGQLLVAGTAAHASYLASLQALAARDGIAVRWAVSPDRGPDDVLDLAASAADQVVLPFYDASQSASVIFAMTHGNCVVASAVGEVPRTLRDRGLLVAPGDVAQVCRAMALVEDDPEECRRLAAAARQYALEELAWSKVAASTVEVYRNA